MTPVGPLAAIASPKSCEDLHFNRGLTKNNRIHYSLMINLQNSTITLSHYGSSELYSTSPPLVFHSPNRLDELLFVSLNVFGAKTVEFYNIRSGLHQIPSVLNPLGQDQQVHPSKAVQQLAQPQGALQKQIMAASNSPKPSFVCKDDTKCPFRSLPKNQATQDHFASYSHRCLFGSACTDQSNSHQNQYTHVVLPPCQDGAQCDLLGDKQHRSEKSHPNCWDFLLPCRRCDSERKDCMSHDQTKYYYLPK